MRILLLKNPEKIVIAGDFGIVMEIDGRKTELKGEVNLKFHPLVIWKGKKRVKNPRYPVRFSPIRGFVHLNGRAYRGEIVVKNVGGDIYVINEVKMEDYLKGVVPLEMGYLREDLIEALKAQAVAARTYAVAHIRRNMPYDMVPTVEDQVYGGVRVESPLTNRAVEETRGVVAVYRGKPIDAKYHSTCGGRTEDNENVWNGKPVPYLRSVRDSKRGKPFCRFSPHFNWVRVYSKEEFFSLIRKNLSEIIGEDPGRVRWVRIRKRTRSGRIKEVEVATAKKRYRIDKDRARRLFRDPKRGSLKSTLFHIETRGNKIYIKGRGFGHGVGMCQFGAMEMAREGYSYKQILKHYYRGIRLKKMW